MIGKVLSKYNKGKFGLVEEQQKERPVGKEMTLAEHLAELKVRLTRILITIGIIALISFLFGIQEFDLGETKVYLPYPSVFNNIASAVVLKLKTDLLPSYVDIIQTSPAQAVIAQLYVAIFLGILVGMPIIVRETWAFISPALYPHEKKTIVSLVIPISLLFALGVAFSYVFVTPVGIDFLYRYGIAMGVTTFVTIEDFISFILIFLVAMGLAFQLPVIMWTTTKLGVVNSDFWKENFRYAVAGMVIFGAVVTPDGSGITMWLVAGPMIALYAGAYILIKKKFPSRPKQVKQEES
jgi:sec-independent protein translocase protein TatC